MDSLTEDLWATILARLPLKNITASKVECKQMKSIVESPFLRKLFLSHHRNSHSLWSLRASYEDHPMEVLAHYGCETWGVPESLGSYVSSFINEKFVSQEARVLAYTDVGLILIRAVSTFGNIVLYVANPVSRECFETDPPWCEPSYQPLGIATRTENGVLLGYKIVLLYDVRHGKKSLSLLIYSSHTGLWSRETVHFSYYFRGGQDFNNSISLGGSLHWLASNKVNDQVVVSIDLYASSYRCRFTPFPDLEKIKRFKRCCTTSQGYLMYMNIVSEGKYDGDKLCVWRLKSGEWQVVSEMSSVNGFENVPLLIDPFDANTVYFWSKYDHCLLSKNLSNGKFVLHSKYDLCSDGSILSNILCDNLVTSIKKYNSSCFLLPQWLYRIPKKSLEINDKVC